MKAIAVVAHPEDCVIFAYSFMNHYKDFDWTVCYLTYKETDARAQEFIKFWSKRGVATKFLGFVDDWHDIENKKISFDEAEAEQQIADAIKDQDIVVTHNSKGEYGHLHHVFVNRAVTKNHDRVITFADFDQGNVKLGIMPGVYDLSELPGCADIVSKFHIDNHYNEYVVSRPVLEMINQAV